MMGLRPASSERGAVAILTAVLAVVIIGFAAFAVDLGNAYARQRVVQNQADLAALAGAARLVESDSAAIAKTLEYIELNEVFGSDYTDSQLTDTVLSNGEIIVEDSVRVRVVAPPATVDFGLAGVIGGSQQDVQAQAVAGIFSPGKLAPFFLPVGCVTPSGGGISNVLFDKSGEAAGIEPAFLESPSNPPKTWPEVSFVSPFELLPTSIAGTMVQELLLQGENLEAIEEIALVWSSVVDDQVFIEATEFTLSPAAKDPDEITVTSVPDDVIDVASGEQRIVYIQVRATGSTQWSAPTIAASFLVRDPNATLPDECGEKNQGDFGLTASPRLDEPNLQNAIQRNFAEGLDHALVEYPSGTSASATAALEAQSIFPYAGPSDQDICKSPNDASPPFVLDLLENRDVPPNCVDLKTGVNNASPDIGMITATVAKDGFKGRLNAPASPICGQTRSVNLGGPLVINDDRLSCFLPPGVTVGQVLYNTSPPELASEIVDSPRFVIVPVIHADIPPGPGGYPIVGFKGALISHEETSSTRNTPVVVPQNGVTLADNGKSIEALTAMYFNLSALPEQVSTSQDVIDYIGAGPVVVKLIE